MAGFQGLLEKVKDYFGGLYKAFSGSRGMQVGAGAMALYVLLLGLWFNSQMSNAMAIEINGNRVAMVADENHAEKILNEVKREKENSVGQKVEIKEQILLVSAKSKEIMEDAKLKQVLASSLTFTTEATGIKVNDEIKVILSNEEVAQEVIEALKVVELKNKDQLVIESVEIEETINLVKIETEVSKLVSKETAVNQLKFGEAEKSVTHKVAKGDSLWTIAKQYKLSVDQLIEANPELDPGALQINQELEIVKHEPLVNIVVKGKSTVVKELAFETEVKRDSTLTRGKEKVEKEGKKGKVENTYKVVIRNGKVVEEDLLKEKVIEKATPKVVVRGTKTTVIASRGNSNEEYNGGGSGNFGWPARGQLTSPFGGKRNHSGIDIANSTGTAIYASKSGTVVFSGWHGGYGNVVDIDHGDGYLTRYAHNSRNLVSVGERVSRGEVIAHMGSTGRSTGPHVHFEIRRGGRWGTALNPINYLR